MQYCIKNVSAVRGLLHPSGFYCKYEFEINYEKQTLVWTVRERDLHSRSSSEFLRGRIRKISSPSHPIFFFFFFFFFCLILNFGLVGGLLHVFFFYVTGVLGGSVEEMQW